MAALENKMAALSTHPAKFAVRGRFVHANARRAGLIEFVEDGLIVVEDGAIVAVAKDADQIKAVLAEHRPQDVVELAETEFLAPGMVDCHVHAPQYAYSGTATDKPLMEWLQHYTFPAEKRCVDVDYAKTLYSALVDRLLMQGTTCVALYATIHVPATNALVDICLEKGLRAVVGKVCMDRHGGDGYEETTAEALEGTRACLDYIRKAQPGASGLSRLVQPCVIPRFIPTCTPELLAGLGDIARESDDVWVQSHASEAPDQVKFVDTLHPGKRCTEIFESHGLLTDKCVMAHCVYLEDGELDTFARKGAGVACCPLSNAIFSLSPGWHAFPFHKAHAKGVRVGMGTDIAGGYAASILVACRHAAVASEPAWKSTSRRWRGIEWGARNLIFTQVQARHGREGRRLQGRVLGRDARRGPRPGPGHGPRQLRGGQAVRRGAHQLRGGQLRHVPVGDPPVLPVAAGARLREVREPRRRPQHRERLRPGQAAPLISLLLVHMSHIAGAYLRSLVYMSSPDHSPLF